MKASSKRKSQLPISTQLKEKNTKKKQKKKHKEALRIRWEEKEKTVTEKQGTQRGKKQKQTSHHPVLGFPPFEDKAYTFEC